MSVISKLNILRYQDPLTDSDQTENSIGHSTLRTIEPNKNHRSIIAANNQNMDRQFSFQEIQKKERNQDIVNLDSSKACQDNQILQRRLSKQTLIFSQKLHTRSFIKP